MPFREILTDLMHSVPGSMGAIFADWEGEAVDQVTRNGDSDHVKFLGAHHGILLQNVQKISETTRTGDPELFMVRTEELDYFTAPVHDGYFVVLAVDSGSIPARAQAAMKIAVRFIREEMGY